MSNATDVRHHSAVAHHLESLPPPHVHVGVTDRLSLRLGLWLLVRSAERVELQADHAAQQLRVRNDRDRETREVAFARERLLWPTR